MSSGGFGFPDKRFKAFQGAEDRLQRLFKIRSGASGWICGFPERIAQYIIYIAPFGIFCFKKLPVFFEPAVQFRRGHLPAVVPVFVNKVAPNFGGSPY